ncbi:MAG: transaldolase [Actinobacteria bacterium HGW-Actinobacteria-7]|jgi:transaldolase/glucose-6-phosphate isomerase|nr:MAG: transaldolase [Actinobacteria bacterium HGW-Actinobacteria-7]
MATIKALNDAGQSLWLDGIRRAMLDSGELEALVAQGLSGVTTNPTLFDRAISGTEDYDAAIAAAAGRGAGVTAVYEELVIEDIRRTAAILRPVFDATDGGDGFVSVEVDPRLAHDTSATLAEARRYFAAIDVPNLMVKVPATAEGIPAIEELIADGRSVNVTLMFSVDDYDAVAGAYVRGLERLVASGGDPSTLRSVASFFVSRIDAAIDPLLEAVGIPELRGTIGIANGVAAYLRFRDLLASERWVSLAALGAKPQRVLWASTGVKDPAFSDVLYVEELMGPETVDTVPLATMRAFLDHGSAGDRLTGQADAARERLARLAEAGIDLGALTARLKTEGVAAFVGSLKGLFGSIEAKLARLQAGHPSREVRLGGAQAGVDAAFAEIVKNGIVDRVWNRDHTVWAESPGEIDNRLGWLDLPDEMTAQVERLRAFADQARSDGYTHAVLLGMGGSSLAPEVFRKTFGIADGYLDLLVLDSTHPDVVAAVESQLDLARTLFVVSSKSGGTAETLSLFKYFYNRIAALVDTSEIGSHFVAVTDPGTSLEALGRDLGFREVFLANPNLGGRYSALSHFGLVPAALIGVDLDRLLASAQGAVLACETCVATAANPGVWLGAALGALSKNGRDKATFVTSAQFASFGDWVEQLIAESTGKSGHGILPVVGEPLGVPGVYGDDRVFIELYVAGDARDSPRIDALAAAGHPVLQFGVVDAYDLGAQMFLWEMAIAVAGHVMGIHPFNQPDVEAAKILARGAIERYKSEGSLPSETPSAVAGDVDIFGGNADDPAQALGDLLASKRAGDYVAIQAYVRASEETDAALRSLRLRVRNETRLATTLGYGPRFLHSTGQLHKGDAGHGLFLQITSEPAADIAIPDEPGSSASSLSFGVLTAAEAGGDRQVLHERGRRVVSLHVRGDVVATIKKLQTWDSVRLAE